LYYLTLGRSVSDLQHHRDYELGTAITLTAVQACFSFESQPGRIPKSTNLYDALFLRSECTYWRIL